MFTGGAVDSKAPVTVNCSSHWFDAKDGVAAVGWYEQGVRFLDYRTPTDIQQVGYYIPANGSTWAAYWSPTDPNGEIVYTADAYRGVDVLKIDSGGTTGKKVKAPVQQQLVRQRRRQRTILVQRRSSRTRRSASMCPVSSKAARRDTPERRRATGRSGARTSTPAGLPSCTSTSAPPVRPATRGHRAPLPGCRGRSRRTPRGTRAAGVRAARRG